MVRNPYSSPEAELGARSWFGPALKASLPWAALSAFLIPAVIMGIDLARGVPIARFVAAPGFLGAVGSLSILSALALSGIQLPAWARVILTPLLAAIGLVVLVLVLNIVAR